MQRRSLQVNGSKIYPLFHCVVTAKVPNITVHVAHGNEHDAYIVFLALSLAFIRPTIRRGRSGRRYLKIKETPERYVRRIPAQSQHRLFEIFTRRLGPAREIGYIGSRSLCIMPIPRDHVF
ncbi:hypothetical protein F5I97DRAFT_679684 [Phlebopus sp. FC_14]|nr:hypothetical protein F5I97DRAFT_679684 [Phlebopus sp. FC_14]